jgi:hypothetical protein
MEQVVLEASAERALVRGASRPDDGSEARVTEDAEVVKEEEVEEGDGGVCNRASECFLRMC